MAESAYGAELAGGGLKPSLLWPDGGINSGQVGRTSAGKRGASRKLANFGKRRLRRL